MAVYYFNRILELPLDEAEERVVEKLSEMGFGILTEIDVKATLKEKLDVDFRPYKILGACNPPFAHRALEAEEKIGTMLPCNVVLQEIGEGVTEVAAVDPIQSMRAVKNDELALIAIEIRDRIIRVIGEL